MKNKSNDKGQLTSQINFYITSKLQTISFLEDLLGEDIESINKRLRKGYDKPEVSQLSEKAFNAAKSLSSNVATFLVSDDNPTGKKFNENIVELLWFAQSRRHYKKGNAAEPKKNFKIGDFVIYVQPEKYNSSYAYVASMLGSVEDYFTNVLEGCGGPFCLKGSVKRKPIKHKIIKFINRQEQVDDEEFAELQKKGNQHDNDTDDKDEGDGDKQNYVDTFDDEEEEEEYEEEDDED